MVTTGTKQHALSIVTTKFLLSAVSFLEELRPIPTLKTICGNHGRRKNVAREQTSAEGLASTQKRVANGGRRGVGGKRRATASGIEQHLSCLWC
ncbi:hypothetical protein TNCV_4718421 [Trichonephila clavipes]|nr:hypothetical protein TNCV_4718421 [Trichonephila clavipes]